MARFYKKISKKTGGSPGTLVQVGGETAEKTKLAFFDYDKDRYEEKKLRSVAEAIPFKNKPTVSWLHIVGFSQPDLLEEIGKHFNIHPLVLEDVQNTVQRPKIENYDDYLYIVVKNLLQNNDGLIEGEQLSIIVGENFVLTFQETSNELFEPIHQRIKINDSRLRKSGADYLAYRLLDTVIDHYFVILESVGQEIEAIEDELITAPSQITLEAIHKLKRELLFLRKTILPVREVMGAMVRGDIKLIKKATGLFLRDAQDHTIQVIDSIESLRDVASGILDTYLSLASNSMNEVMKMLTIIATIFIPLTFIAGIYGMNFKVMPELEWQWGYGTVWAVMLIVAAVMVVYFKRKRWL